MSCFIPQLEGWIVPFQAEGAQPAAALWSLGSGLAWPMWSTATPAPASGPPLATIRAPGSQPERASRGRGNGGSHAGDDSVGEMRKSKGLIKTLKLVPNEVSHRSALEGSQALSREQCLFPDRVPAAPRCHPQPTLPLEGKWDLNPRAEPGGPGVRGHVGGGCEDQHLRCLQGTRGGQVGHRMRAGAGGPLSTASLPGSNCWFVKIH